MSQVALVIKPSSREVREFAIREGLAQPGQGRLSRQAIDAFNRNRRGVHRYVKAEPVARHTVYGPQGGVVRVRNYNREDARAWAVRNGYSAPGARGRLSRGALDAYVMSL
jgi:hypothetical protein